MKFKLKILSPLHIGCGDKYSGLNFILHDGKLFSIDANVFINALDRQKADKFISWIDRCTDAIDKLESQKWTLKKARPPANPNEIRTVNDALRKQRQNFTLKKFVEENGVNLQQITAQALYFTDIQDGVYNDSEINSFIKQMNRPYVPGTEIKGAVRTAILYCALMDNQQILSWLKNKLEQFQREHANDIARVKNEKKPDQRTKNKLVEAMAEIEAAFQAEVLCCKPNDAKYDVMKYLHISDSALLNPDRNLAVSYVKPFNISQSFSTFYEYLKPDIEVSLPTFALENTHSLSIKLENMAFTEPHKKIVSGLDIILRSCHRFTNDLLAEEISFFKAHGKANIASQLERIAKINRPDAPVIRIGKDEGFNSLTVGLAVKKLAPDLYENVLIHATKNKSYDASHGGPLPKSRKIVYWNGSETTAGWVQLLPENHSTAQPSKDDFGNKAHAQAQAAKPSDLSKLQHKFKVKTKKS